MPPRRRLDWACRGRLEGHSRTERSFILMSGPVFDPHRMCRYCALDEMLVSAAELLIGAVNRRWMNQVGPWRSQQT